MAKKFIIGLAVIFMVAPAFAQTPIKHLNLFGGLFTVADNDTLYFLRGTLGDTLFALVPDSLADSTIDEYDVVLVLTRDTTTSVRYATWEADIDTVTEIAGALVATPVTDNALIRFHGTVGDTIQNSVITVDDQGNVQWPAAGNDITVKIADQGGDFDGDNLYIRASNATFGSNQGGSVYIYPGTGTSTAGNVIIADTSVGGKVGIATTTVTNPLTVYTVVDDGILLSSEKPVAGADSSMQLKINAGGNAQIVMRGSDGDAFIITETGTGTSFSEVNNGFFDWYFPAAGTMTTRFYQNGGILETTITQTPSLYTLSTENTGNSILFDPNTAGVGIMTIGQSGDNDTLKVVGAFLLNGAEVVSGSGDIILLAGDSVVDNDIVRWHGTSGDTIQSADFAYTDAGVFQFPGDFTMDPDTAGVGLITLGLAGDNDSVKVAGSQLQIVQTATANPFGASGPQLVIQGTTYARIDLLDADGNDFKVEVDNNTLTVSTAAGDDFYFRDGGHFELEVGDFLVANLATIDPNSAGVGLLQLGETGDNDTVNVVGTLQVNGSTITTGTGDVVQRDGASLNDNEIALWHGTSGDTLQSSGVFIADNQVLDVNTAGGGLLTFSPLGDFDTLKVNGPIDIQGAAKVLQANDHLLEVYSNGNQSNASLILFDMNNASANQSLLALDNAGSGATLDMIGTTALITSSSADMTIDPDTSGVGNVTVGITGDNDTLEVIGTLLVNGIEISTTGTGSVITASAADATPTVSGAYILKVPSVVTITQFDDGVDNQLIEVIATGDSVTISDNANISLPLDAAITLHTNDTMILRKVGAVWYYRYSVIF